MERNSKKIKMVSKIVGVALVIIVLIAIALYFVFVKPSIDYKVAANETHIIEIQKNVDETINDNYQSGQYGFDAPYVVLNPYAISPLTALIMFETANETQITVTIDKADGTTLAHNVIEYTFPSAKQHRLPIYGLYAGVENRVTLTTSDGNSHVERLTPTALPNDFIVPTSVISEEQDINDGLYFVTPTTQNASTAAYDNNGDVRWYINRNFAWDIQRLQNGNIMVSSDRTVAPPYYTVGLIEMDLLGKVYNEYVLPGGYHHDVYELENGNLIVATNDFSEHTVEDVIVEIDRNTAEIVKVWDLKDVLPQDEGKALDWISFDWHHNNSVWYDKPSNSIVLSGRHQDAVVSLDYDTGELNWIIGDKTNWSEEMHKYFFTPKEGQTEFEWQWEQHDAKILPNGDVMIFDNGNNKSKIEKDYVEAKDSYSRAVIYKIDTDKMEIEQVWQYGKERGSGYYSPYVSNAEYLGVDHYLIHSGGIGTLNGEPLNQPAPFYEDAVAKSITTEVVNGEIVFEMTLPANYYRGKKLKIYDNDNHFNFTEGSIKGELGITEKYDDLIKVPRIYNGKVNSGVKFDVIVEEDRIRFEGTYKKGTAVALILEQPNGDGVERSIYIIPTVSLPYTAACIDVFNGAVQTSDGTVSNPFFINKEGLEGRYNVLLLIDENKYYTEKYFEV